MSAPDLMFGLSATVAGPGFLVWNERLVFRSDAALCLLRSIGSVRNTDPAVSLALLARRDPHARIPFGPRSPIRGVLNAGTIRTRGTSWPAKPDLLVG